MFTVQMSLGKTSKLSKRNQAKPEEDYAKVPHTFVFTRGVIGKVSFQLMKDFRRVFEPFTARDLEAKGSNSLKDFLTVAGPLGVNYFSVFSKTDLGNNLRVMRLSRGPTMTFRITEFSLAKDIASSIKKQSMYAGQFLHPPLLVLNNFGGTSLHLKLMATMFQNMFPPIDVNEVKINSIRRCVMVNYNEETKLIDFRHYSIKALPVGMSRCVKKLIQPKIPSLQHYQDVSDYFLNTGNLSESEAELDGEHNEVTLPQKMTSRGNIAKEKSAVRLVEIGPRMTLELIKIEEGLSEGEVLYHSYVTKSKQEIAQLRDRRTSKRNKKAQRKRMQEQNVKKKQQQKEEHKQKSLAGNVKKQEEEGEGGEGAAEEKDVDDDMEYYRQEVGEEPDPDLFPKKNRAATGGPLKRRASHPMRGGMQNKRYKTGTKGSEGNFGSKGSEGRFGSKGRSEGKFASKGSEGKFGSKGRSEGRFGSKGSEGKFDMTFSKGQQAKGKVFRKSSSVVNRDRKFPAGRQTAGKGFKGSTKHKSSFRKR
ncbi:putative suppressor of SWI4 1-like [Apostichopus japonicus]|uniref:Putative suppressor of SWI4 1-like n=1 Tax=Stichopus japonicus TaxID=307972 RepID=A0A2G8JT19_STIJA|nr:putative suppressor of SWI4 1-like [Apostichopus japonicus]